MNACIKSKIAKQKKDGSELKHRKPPDEDDLLDALEGHFNLVDHFNDENREEKLVFYDVEHDYNGRWYKYELIYAEYAALFYAPQPSRGDKDDWHVDLHVRRIQENLRIQNQYCFVYAKSCTNKRMKKNFGVKQFHDIYKKKT